MRGWQVGNFDRRGDMAMYDRTCNLFLKSKQYGLIIDSNAESMSPAMAALIASLPPEVCVYLSPFTFIGSRLVDNGVNGTAGNNDMITSSFLIRPVLWLTE